MADREPETCIDCGREVPGGGYCRTCLRERMHKISEALDRAIYDSADDFWGRPRRA